MKILHWHSVHIIPRTDAEGNKNFITEASDLGLKPGEWPELIVIIDDEHKRKFSFKRFTRIAGESDELYGYSYKTEHGFELDVYND